MAANELMYVASFIVNTGSLDRDSERVLPSGGEFDEFLKNPIALYNHRRCGWWTEDPTTERPIGIWQNHHRLGEEPEAPHVFDLYMLADSNNPLRQELLADIQTGIVRTASIGFKPLLISDEDGDKLEGQTGVTFLRWKLIEISPVDFPSNTDAVVIDRYSEDEDEKQSKRKKGKNQSSPTAKSYTEAYRQAQSKGKAVPMDGIVYKNAAFRLDPDKVGEKKKGLNIELNFKSKSKSMSLLKLFSNWGLNIPKGTSEQDAEKALKAQLEELAELKAKDKQKDPNPEDKGKGKSDGSPEDKGKDDKGKQKDPNPEPENDVPESFEKALEPIVGTLETIADGMKNIVERVSQLEKGDSTTGNKLKNIEGQLGDLFAKKDTGTTKEGDDPVTAASNFKETVNNRFKEVKSEGIDIDKEREKRLQGKR